MERFNVYLKQHVRMFSGILWLKEGRYQNIVENGQKTELQSFQYRIIHRTITCHNNCMILI